MSYVLKFSDPEAELLPRSGGKGSSLSKLFRAGFPVPPGFMIEIGRASCRERV